VPNPAVLVGLIADTHGLLRPEVARAFQGVDAILHAGDVGRTAVLDGLRDIASVHAVCGNIDPPEARLPLALECTLAGVRIHMSHGHECGSPTPQRLAAMYAADVLVFGHTHRSLIQAVGNTLVVNPGAAGPARFGLRPSVALLALPALDARIVWL